MDFKQSVFPRWRGFNILGMFCSKASVAQDQPFKSRFTEMAAISISVAVLSFIVGILAKKFLGNIM